MPNQDDRRRVGFILIGASVLTLAFAAVIMSGVIDLGEVRLQVAGLLVFVAIADVFLAWRLYLTPRA